MDYRPLGKSGLTVSAIGFGAFASGSTWWSEVDDDEVIEAMQLAFDLGVTLFDTAPVYGFGRSEELLARALGSHRQEIIIATKFGLTGDGTTAREGIVRDSSRKRILSEVDESLARLKTDYIDIYQQHWPDPATPLREIMETLVELRQAGKIRYIGVSNFDVPMMREALQFAPVVALQPPYSILRREIEAEILPFCQEHGLGVLPYGPLQHGLLSGKYTPESRFAQGDWRFGAEAEYGFSEGRYLRSLQIVEALKPVAAARGVTMAQLAIAWSLMHPAVSCTLVGAKRPAQMQENVGGIGWRLTEAEMQRIEEILQTT